MLCLSCFYYQIFPFLCILWYVCMCMYACMRIFHIFAVMCCAALRCAALRCAALRCAALRRAAPQSRVLFVYARQSALYGTARSKTTRHKRCVHRGRRTQVANARLATFPTCVGGPVGNSLAIELFSLPRQ